MVKHVEKIVLRGRKRINYFQVQVEDELVATKHVPTILSGPSGSGKTVLSRLMLGLDQPTEGDVRWLLEDGRNVFPSRKGYRIGYMPQGLVVFSGLSLLRNLLLFPSKGRGDTEQVNRLIEEFELGRILKRHPHFCSGGEIRRLMLARALASAPHILVLDEPTSYLDHASVEKLSLILRNRSFGLEDTVIAIVTHDEPFVESVGGEVYEVEEGVVRHRETVRSEQRRSR